MFKKIAIAVAAITVGVSLIVGPVYLISLVSSCVQDARDWARDQVPPEREIQRLKREVAKLDRDTVDNIEAIAKKKVAVERLEKETKDLQTALAGQKNRILTLRATLEEKEPFVFDGKVYSKKRITNDLAYSVAVYKTTSRDLDLKRELLTQEERNLQAAKDELRNMQQAKHDLEVELATLEAEVKKVRAAEAKNNGQVHIDNSRLTRIKKDVERVKDRVKVMQEKLKLQAEFGTDPIPVEEKVNEKELLKEVDNLFSKDANKVVHN